MTPNEERQEQAISKAIARLRGRILALVFGMTAGSMLWLATVWLVARGGQRVGEHLSLLRYYFPGYTVTWGGAFVGFFYGALVGGVVGYLIAWVYNRLVDLRRD